MVLSGSIEHTLVGCDLIGLCIDGCFQGALVDIGEFIVGMYFAIEDIARALDHVVDGNDFIDAEMGRNVVVAVGPGQRECIAFGTGMDVQVVGDTAIHGHRDQSEVDVGVDLDGAVQGEAFNVVDAWIIDDPQHAHTINWFDVHWHVIGDHLIHSAVSFDVGGFDHVCFRQI